MKLIFLLIKVVYSILFASMSLIFTIIILQSKSIHSTFLNKNMISPTLIFLISVSLIFLYITRQPDSLIGLFQGIASILIISTIAYFDQFSGRIPVFILIFSIMFGLMVFIIEKHSNFLLGGLSNLLISLIIYFFGELFSRRYEHLHRKHTPFGFGDVYGFSSLGFLMGYPDSFWSILLTLGFSLIFAMISAIYKKKSFLHMRVRMGFPMFLSGGFLLAYRTFFVH